MTIPEPSWSELAAVVVSAAIGWVMRWLQVWQFPSTRKDGE